MWTVDQGRANCILVMFWILQGLCPFNRPKDQSQGLCNATVYIQYTLCYTKGVSQNMWGDSHMFGDV